MLYTYGLGLGARLLLSGYVKHALPYLIRPVNYWRTAEYGSVWHEADFRSSDKILDIGSPKLLSLYLAEKVGAKVVTTDIENYFVDRFKLLRALKGIPADRLSIAVEDGRYLGFDTATFDKVYSISVLEHIPDNGDTACVREIGRVLKPGGRAIITVPFSPESKTEYTGGSFYWAGSSTTADSGQVFFQRRYSESDLYERLIKPSGLALRRLSYIGETVMTNSEGEFSDRLPVVTGPIQPLLSYLFHTRPVDSWQQLEKPLCAVVVLEK